MTRSSAPETEQEPVEREPLPPAKQAFVRLLLTLDNLDVADREPVLTFRLRVRRE